MRRAGERKADQAVAGVCFCSISTDIHHQGEFLRLLAAFSDFKKIHTHGTRNTGTVKAPFATSSTLVIHKYLQTSCANHKEHFITKAYFMQCSPEELQYFLDYKMDPAPPSSCLLIPAQSVQENA